MKGDIIYRFRYAVIGLVAGALLALGGGEIVDLVETIPVTDPITEQIALLPDGRPATRPRPIRRVRPRRINSDAPTVRLDDAVKEVAGKDG